MTVTEIMNFLNGFQGRYYSTPSTYVPYFTIFSNVNYLTLQYDSFYGYAIHDYELESKTRTEVVFSGGSSYRSDGSGTMYYQGEKKVSSLQLNPLGFVIGNNADQYPSSGEKGGYWYELIGQITSTNALSLSDSAYDLTRDIAVEEIRNEVILNVNS